MHYPARAEIHCMRHEIPCINDSYSLLGPGKFAALGAGNYAYAPDSSGGPARHIRTNGPKSRENPC